MANELILIVDDDPQNLKMLTKLLTREGYEIRTAMNADETLQVLQNFQPALILMDIQLPGLDGLELTRKLLKSDEKYRDTVILAITAYGEKHDNEIALAAGCDGYITKPIDTRTFPLLIADYLKNK